MFKSVLVWMSAMGWHLWRIATLRPAFRHMSDTRPMAISFMGVFFAAGLLRWVVLNDEPKASALSAGFGLFVYMLGVLFVFERSHRSSSLAAAVLGSSAALDLLVSAGVLVGVLDSVRLPTGMGLALEIGWALALKAKFDKEPSYVQASGYRLAKHPVIADAI